MVINKRVGLLAILVILVWIAVGYLWLQANRLKQQSLLTTFPQQYGVVAGKIGWTLKNFQPVVKEFLTENGQNWVVVRYTDLNNLAREARLFVSGRTPGGYQVEEIVFQPREGEVERLSYVLLKKRLKKGTQIRAEYINSVPKQLDVSNCLPISENLRVFCFLTDVLAGQKYPTTTEEELKNGKLQSVILPISFISMKLYAD